MRSDKRQRRRAACLGNGAVLIGILLFVSHSTIWILERLGQPWWLAYGIPRCLMMFALAAILWRSRKQSILPTNSTERLIWSIWIGYLTGYSAAAVMIAVAGQDHLQVYPVAAIVSGVCFFIMGSHIWGGNYLIGLSFLAAAPALPLILPWSPLAFGALWLVAWGLWAVAICGSGESVAETRGHSTQNPQLERIMGPWLTP